MHVITGRAQIAIAAALNQLRLIASAQNVAGHCVPVVEPNGVGALKPLHPRHQIGSLDHQVVMIAHQTESMHLPVCLLTCFGQRLDKVVPVHVAEKDVIPLITAAHYVINGIGILHSHLPGHERSLVPPLLKSQQVIAEHSTV